MDLRGEASTLYAVDVQAMTAARVIILLRRAREAIEELSTQV